MNRVIKFRAWNEKYKFMTNDFYVDGIGCVFEDASRTYDTPNTEIEKTSNLVIMQFTGLHDKNGVEIYEGDVCEITFKDDGEKSPMAVVYSAPRFYLKGDGFWSLDSKDVSLEVIGNIYQNPELLE